MMAMWKLWSRAGCGSDCLMVPRWAGFDRKVPMDKRLCVNTTMHRINDDLAQSQNA
jgi:hypothetical protein